MYPAVNKMLDIEGLHHIRLELGAGEQRSTVVQQFSHSSFESENSKHLRALRDINTYLGLIC